MRQKTCKKKKKKLGALELDSNLNDKRIRFCLQQEYISKYQRGKEFQFDKNIRTCTCVQNNPPTRGDNASQLVLNHDSNPLGGSDQHLYVKSHIITEKLICDHNECVQSIFTNTCGRDRI